jgi:phosphonate transport system substrate-binding protein
MLGSSEKMINKNKLPIFFLMLFFGLISNQTFFPTTVKAAEEVTFAMLPQMSNTQLFKCWNPLLKYLEKKTGLNFTQVFPHNFTEHVALCREGKVNFAYSNPFTYVQMAPKPGERPHGHLAMAMAVEPHGAVFYGEFIVRVDNTNVKEFKDIKGKHGWIVGYTSAGGYLYQRGYALDYGIDLFRDCILTESPGNKQEKVIMAVYNRDTDFGCVRNGMRDKLKDRIDLSQIKVIAETKRYPSWVLSAYDGVDEQIINNVREALLHIPSDLFKDAKLPGGVIKFQEATDMDFKSLRELAEKVKMIY